jgi:hypothetical protein
MTVYCLSLFSAPVKYNFVFNCIGKLPLLHSAIVWPVRFNSGHIHTGQNLQPVKDTLKSWDTGVVFSEGVLNLSCS